MPTGKPVRRGETMRSSVNLWGAFVIAVRNLWEMLLCFCLKCFGEEPTQAKIFILHINSIANFIKNQFECISTSLRKNRLINQNQTIMKMKFLSVWIVVFSLAGCYSPPNNVKFTDYMPIPEDEALKMIEACDDSCSPQKVSYKPEFLKDLNDVYRGYKISFVPAQYITDEQEKRYRERWHLDEADPRGEVLNKATIIIKAKNWWGTTYYLDEAAICPPPGHCDYP